MDDIDITKITSRKDAVAAGLKKYFTGKTCSNGHIAPRYTQSGSCSACVVGAANQYRPTDKQLPVPAAIYPPGYVPRSDACAQLVDTRLRVYPEDYPTLRDAAIACTTTRYPSLTRDDVVGKGTMTDPHGGTYLVRIRLDPVDVHMMREIQNALLGQHKADISAIRNRLTAQAAAEPGENAAAWIDTLFHKPLS
jgi:hypothetical protein